MMTWSNTCDRVVQVVQVAAGGMHSVALTEDGKVFTTGVNDEAALGRCTGQPLMQHGSLLSDIKTLFFVVSYSKSHFNLSNCESTNHGSHGSSSVWSFWQFCHGLCQFHFQRQSLHGKLNNSCSGSLFSQKKGGGFQPSHYHHYMLLEASFWPTEMMNLYWQMRLFGSKRGLLEQYHRMHTSGPLSRYHPTLARL